MTRCRFYSMTTDGDLSLLRKLLPTSPWHRRRRSASAARVGTTSNTSNANNIGGGFNRLAASLRLPHYCGHGQISGASTIRTNDRVHLHQTIVKSATLSHGVTIRSYSEQDDDRRIADSGGILSRPPNTISLKQTSLVIRFSTESVINLGKDSSSDDIVGSNRRLGSVDVDDVTSDMLRRRMIASCLKKTSFVDDMTDSMTTSMTATATRTFLREGRVLLSTAMQTQQRYLFLFNDLLLIAKEKDASSFKLKEKIRLQEVWLSSDNVDEVSECVRQLDNSFVIGWPTNNYVAEFASSTERNQWYTLLEQTIADEKERESPKSTIVKIYLKSTTKNHEPLRRIPINNLQSANDLKRIAIVELDLNPELEYQLWAHSIKENAPYPLYGHESPFAIVMSHVRDMLQDTGHGLSNRELEDIANIPTVNAKFRFVLRARDHTSAPSARRSRLRRATAAGHFVNQIRKRVLPSSAAVPKAVDCVDVPLTSNGQLFGQPLHQLTAENAVPEPVMKMLKHIYCEGAIVEGIFRKSPKQSTVKLVKCQLDDGRSVDFEHEHNPLVTASVLKDFLRNIPRKLLVSDLYYQWVRDVCDTQLNPDHRLANCRKLLSRLPPANYQLLRHLLCVLHHVTSMHATSKMSAASLSVCIGPSLLDKPTIVANDHQMQMHDSVKLIPQLTEFLIDHVYELFGADTMNLFSDQQQSTKVDHSSEDSDDFGALRHQDFSSIDSIPVGDGTSPIANRPSANTTAWTRHNPTNESRDSGLSDNFLTDDSIAPTTTTIPRSSPQRSFSQTDNSDGVSLESGVIVNGDGGGMVTVRSVSDLLDTNVINNNTTASSKDRRKSVSVTDTWSDWSATNTTATDNKKSVSPDSAVFVVDQHRSTALRNSKRLAYGTLQKSTSGQHLVIDDDATEHPSSTIPGPIVIRCNSSSQDDVEPPSNRTSTYAIRKCLQTPAKLESAPNNYQRRRHSSSSSSTVTESSDDERTPIISRENSNVTDLRPQPDRYSTMVDSSSTRPMYSWRKNSTTLDARLQPPPPTYEETMRRRNEFDYVLARERVSGAIAKTMAASGAGPAMPTIQSITVSRSSKVQQQVRKIDRSRRKTFGGEQFREIGDQARQQQPQLPIHKHRHHAPPPAQLLNRIGSTENLLTHQQPIPKLHHHQQQLVSFDSRPLEINWSVNRLRSLFDGRQQLAPRISHPHSNYSVVTPPPSSNKPLRLACAQLSSRPQSSCSSTTSTGIVRSLASNFENRSLPPVYRKTSSATIPDISYV